MNLAAAFDWLPASNSEQQAYEILGIPKRAKNEEIKRAYRKLIMISHPDKGGNGGRSIQINEAYKLIRLKRGI